MTTFLSFQATYHSIEIALFKNAQLIDQASEEKTRASKNFFVRLQELMTSHDIKNSDLSFLVINLGPGPFTTLRVAIASVNGISFGTKIPMIGVDGLDAFLAEYRSPHYSYTVILLNAFNKDVYFAIENSQNGNLEKGCENIIRLLERLKLAIPAHATIQFLGNGCEMYKNEIHQLFGSQAIMHNPMPQTCSIKQIGIMGLEKWHQNPEKSFQLLPLYVKQPQIF